MDKEINLTADDFQEEEDIYYAELEDVNILFEKDYINEDMTLEDAALISKSYLRDYYEKKDKIIEKILSQDSSSFKFFDGYNEEQLKECLGVPTIDLSNYCVNWMNPDPNKLGDHWVGYDFKKSIDDFDSYYIQG